MDCPVSALDAVFDAFLAVQARITANLEAHAAGLGLNASQLLVVRDVLDHPGTSLKDLCQRCGLKKSAASRLVDALAARQLVLRQECPTSRRAVALFLGPGLDGQFCRVTALQKAFPQWNDPSRAPEYPVLLEGLKGLLQLATPEQRQSAGSAD